MSVFKPKVVQHIRGFVNSRKPSHQTELVDFQREVEPPTFDRLREDTIVRFSAEYHCLATIPDGMSKEASYRRAAQQMVAGLYDDTVMELRAISRRLVLDGAQEYSPDGLERLHDLISSLQGDFE